MFDIITFPHVKKIFSFETHHKWIQKIPYMLSKMYCEANTLFCFWTAYTPHLLSCLLQNLQEKNNQETTWKEQYLDVNFETVLLLFCCTLDFFFCHILSFVIWDFIILASKSGWWGVCVCVRCSKTTIVTHNIKGGNKIYISTFPT